MYYYVQDRAAIKSAFANCLGGLLTVVAKDIVLELRPVKGVKITKIMTKYEHKFVAASNCWQVSVGDMYKYVNCQTAWACTFANHQTS